MTTECNDPELIVFADETEELHQAEIRNLKLREENLKTIHKELDAVFQLILSNELSELEKISAFADSVELKLLGHYAHIFPKKCNNCGRTYKDREQYLNETKRLGRTSTVYDEIGLQEYRNCVCGSTLVLWSQDRRDNTPYGISRRKLFDDCVDKILSLSDAPRDLVAERVRQIFSRIAA